MELKHFMILVLLVSMIAHTIGTVLLDNEKYKSTGSSLINLGFGLFLITMLFVIDKVI